MAFEILHLIEPPFKNVVGVEKILNKYASVGMNTDSKGRGTGDRVMNGLLRLVDNLRCFSSFIMDKKSLLW